MADKSTSNHNAMVLQEGVPVESMGWLEKKIKPTKINARYPIKGSALWYATCELGSLGDALFGYNSGEWYNLPLS